MLKRVAVRVFGEKKGKSVHPHLLRHCRCTHVSDKLTEMEMKGYFGWTAKSRMPATYSHLSAHDIENSVSEKVYGIETAQTKHKKEENKPKICVSCGKENPPDARFCNCGNVLDIKTAIELDHKMKDARFVDKTISADMTRLQQELEDMKQKFKMLAAR